MTMPKPTRFVIAIACLCAVVLATKAEDKAEGNIITKGDVDVRLEALVQDLKLNVEQTGAYAARMILREFEDTENADKQLSKVQREELKKVSEDKAFEASMIVQVDGATTPVPSNNMNFLKIIKEKYLDEKKTFSLRFEGKFVKEDGELGEDLCRTWVFKHSGDDGYHVTHKWDTLPSEEANLEILTKTLGYAKEDLDLEHVEKDTVIPKEDNMTGVLAYLLYVEYFCLEAINQPELYRIKTVNNTCHPSIVEGDLLHKSSLTWLWVILAVVGSMVLGFVLYRMMGTEKTPNYAYNPQIHV